MPFPNRDAASASSSISSPPNSPPQLEGEEIAVARPPSDFHPPPGVVLPHHHPAAPANPTATTATHLQPAHQHTRPQASSTQNVAADAPKPKRQRKTAERKSDAHTPSKPAAAADERVKEKKPRKPREPKVKKESDSTPAASTAAAGGGGGAATAAAAPRKRQKIDDKSTALLPSDGSTGPRQSTLPEMVNHFQHPGAPASASQQQQTQQQQQQPPLKYTNFGPSPQSTAYANHVSSADTRNSMPPQLSAPQTPIARPYSSGQNYDPIRGATRDSAPPRTAVVTVDPPAPAVAPASSASAAPSAPAASAQASPRANRASASPSIHSLIDPPSTKVKASATTFTIHSPLQQPHQRHPSPALFASLPSSTPPAAAAAAAAAAPLQLTAVEAASRPSAPPDLGRRSSATGLNGAVDVDNPSCDASAMLHPPPEVKIQSKSSSSAPTPKPVPAKVNTPPKATGSGLLSSSDLFGGPAAANTSERKGVDIDIDIQLDRRGGNTINMAQEIAKRYGRDAINPRVAAHRERLLQIAAAANKLEPGSADDMSVDLMSDVDGDSNVEMGGMDEEKSATEDKPRKRKKKVEEYDKEDDFIDDTELAWQERAAVAKDGFFVYSGPLIRESDKAQLDSATSSRGGRGGRGRGRGRAAAAANASAAGGATHASVAEKNKEPSATGRGRGRGRGTGAPRKPRVTKADRERMEIEKLEREKSAFGATLGLPPATATATAAVTTATTMAPASASTNGPSAVQTQQAPALSQPYHHPAPVQSHQQAAVAQGAI